MSHNFDFENALMEALSGATLSEVEDYGYCLFGETYKTDMGQEIKLVINELDGKTYLLKYVDGACVQFKDITALKKDRNKAKV